MNVERFPPCPHRRNDCRLYSGGQMSTCLAWHREYDRDGNLLTADPNITTETLGCSACGKRWVRTEQGGKAAVREVPE